MYLRPTTAVSLHHGLHITTELKQGIAILQMSASDLCDYIAKCVEENPFLDDDDWRDPVHPYEPDRYIRDMSSDDLFEKRGHGSPERFDNERPADSERAFSFDRYLVEDSSLEDHLISQLDMAKIDEEQRRVASYLVGCIDGEGYMRTPVSFVAETLGVSQDAVRSALDVIQRFDPPGIGATNLSECLRLQALASGAITPLIERLLDGCLEDFASRTPAAIARSLGVPLGELSEALETLRSFNPHPGCQFGVSAQPIWPEIVVERDGDGGFSVRLQDFYLPHLRVNPHYRILAETTRESDAAGAYLAEKLKEAEGVIDGVRYRKETLYKVACCVMEMQSSFLEHGYEALKPLTMEQVSRQAGVSESTVSRLVNDNYVQTPQGVFELRFFFHSAVGGSSDAASSESVRFRMRSLIAAEDPAHPLSDQAIADALGRDGIAISRRTVAKYRGELGIPVRAARKRI